MKRLLLAAALSLGLTFAAQARSHSIDSCGLDSDYDVTLDKSGLTFRHEGGKPGIIVMSKGQLIVDGRPLAISDADRARVAEYEATVRALVPQAKAIARDAIDVAYVAVTEVAAAFSSTADSSATRNRLAGLRDEFKLRIDDTFEKRPWNEDEFDSLVEKAMGDLMPVVLAEVAGNAIAIALSGDEARAAELEKRAEKLERDIERRIDTQTAQLASRVAALCPMVVKLDSLEDGLDLRLADGARLNLLNLDD
ncbi:MAG TPA: DUF2884 family protein [Tahibacter sp.]|uniref:DUF2884 family protein n=1 Tax=Tahibacter sp. TaxID=2056211 RepID=UPI002CD23944|nr:DUF2884 family protein [Tahibacter sp.]HSX62001.1 DUF2884 family protein [Tahibacter sp.]